MADGTVRLRILSAGAPKTGVSRCAEAFEQANGTGSDVTFTTAPDVRARVEAGEDGADIVVAPLAAVEAFEAEGRVVAGTGAVVGSVRAGVVVRADAPDPDIATADALRRTLLEAAAVVYNTASSGLYIERMIERLGIMDAIGGRIVRVPNGGAVMQRLAEGTADNEIGFGQATEIRLQAERSGRVRFAGPLPREVENVTTYAVAVRSDAASPGPATALAAFMGSPEGRAILAAAGVE